VRATSEAERRAFVLGHTHVAVAPLIPELRLHLAGDVTRLWQVTESWLTGEGIAPPFWAFAWAGGQALARYVLDHADVVRGRTVIDFGAGSGLVAIAAAMMGAKHVRALDVDSIAATACAMNAVENGVTVEVSLGDLVGSALEGVDVVLAGDMFYEREPASRFTTWMRELARSDKLVLAGDPERDYVPDGLELMARYEVPTSVELEGREFKTGNVWCLRSGDR
jgi:predicted nicotinamide N-methyase